MPSPPDIAAQREMGERLKLLREIFQLSQAAFGERIGVGETTVSAWESGRNQIDIVKLARAAREYGFTIDFIALGSINGMPFDLAQKVQAAQRARSGEAPRRGRPRKAEPTVQDIADAERARATRGLHAPTEPYHPPPKTRGV